MEIVVSYIYKTTNLINGFIYVGKCQGKDIPSYLGSGVNIKKAFEEFGKHNFKKEILEHGIKTLELLNEREIYWIAKLKANDPSIGYNIAKGGRYNSSNQSDKMKANWSNPNWRNPVMDKILSTYKSRTSEQKQESTKKRLLTIENKSDEEKALIKKKMSDSHKGKCNRKGYSQSEETKKKISDSLRGNRNSVGRIPSKQTRELWSKQRKGIKPPNSKLVAQIDPLSFKIIKTYLSYRDADVQMGTVGAIQFAASSFFKGKCKGYYWFAVENLSNEEINSGIVNISKYKK